MSIKRIPTVLLLTAVCVLAAVPAPASVTSSIRRVFKDWGLFQGLQITGSNELTVQQNLVEGSSSAYEGQRWDTDSVVRRTTLGFEGPIWKELSFKADFSSSGYGQSYSSWIMGYVGHDTALYYGDLNVDLSGNQFASFSKAVQGWQLDQKVGKGLMRAFYSKEKAITRTQTIQGNNTSGPFFLTYTPIMQGTEVVKVNEQVQRFGVDYRLDYDTGQLYFEVTGSPAKIIPDTSTITVSYQSQANDSQGTMSGARLLMPLMNDRLQVGVTMLKQDRGGGGGDTVGYQEDIFNGSGSTGPFDVNYRPIIANGTSVVYQGRQQTIQQALLVLVDNVEQAEGVDYDSYRTIGRILFRRSVPPTSLVVIRYYYDLSSTSTTTDNNITGLDLVYHINKKMDVQAEWGKSDTGVASTSGDAMRLNLNYNADKLRFVGEYRDISPNFSYLDSVGFYTQEKGLDLGLNYTPMEHVALYLRRSDVKTNQGYSFGYSGTGYNNYYTTQTGTDTTSGLGIHSTRNDYEVRLDFPNWPTLSFQRQEMANAGGTSDSDYTSNNLSMNWSPQGKPFTLTANLYRTDQSYLSTSSNTSSGSTTDQFQWAASYRPSDKMSVSYSRGRNSSDSVGTTNSSSSNSDQLSLHWAPTRKLDINFDRSNTSSIGSVSSSTYYPTGLYGGGLYTGPLYYRGLYMGTRGIGDGGGIGDDDGDETTENRYNDSSSRMSIRYTPAQKLSFDFSLTKRNYTSGGTVGYLADSDQTTRTMAVNYQLSDALSMNLNLTDDKMAYLEEGRGAVTNKTLGIGANYQKPNSPWGLSLSMSKMDGQSPTYTGYGSSQTMRIVQNNMSDLTARLSYTLSDKSRLQLTGQLSDYAGGYSNFNRQQLEVGYEREISNLARLAFSYRMARNISGGEDDPRLGNTSLVPNNQNYLANTFALTFTTQFNSGMGGSSSSWGASGSSMSNFGGYRAGSGAFGNTGQSYGTGSSFANMGVFGSTNTGSGFSSPFGNDYSSNYGNGSAWGMDYGERPQGYSTFGSSYGGRTGNFSSGLGDVSGRQGGEGFDDLNNPPLNMQPGGEGFQDIEDWYSLDDLNSIWW